MQALMLLLLPIHFVLIYGAFRSTFSESKAREPKLWQIFFATFLILICICLSAGVLSLVLLISILATGVATSWTYNREKWQVRKQPLWEEIREAIAYSDIFTEDISKVTAILRATSYTRKNLFTLLPLLQAGEIKEALLIKLEKATVPSPMYIVTFRTADGRNYISLVHESETSLRLEPAGAWEQCPPQ